MLSTTVTVSNRLGLHARAAAQLVKLVSSFESKVILTRADVDSSADARSILSLLNLAAVSGTVLNIEAVGEDEESTLAAVQRLFESGFNETT